MGRSFLVVGCGVLQVPMILKARDLGLEVIATDMNPEAPGAGLADRFVCANTFDADATLCALDGERPGGVATMGTDFPMRTVAAVGERYGLNTIALATAYRATDKYLMRMAFVEAGVPSPRFARVTSVAEARSAMDDIGLPVIVKPSTRSGSIGVSLVEDAADITAAYDHAVEVARGSDILVEEFVEGPEISVETMTCNGRFRVVAVTQKSTTGAPHFVETGHYIPAAFHADTLRAIHDTAEAANGALGITVGPSHTEMRIRRGHPVLIELGARLGGDRITSHLVPLATGVDMVEATIRLALGDTPDLEPKWSRGAAIRYHQGGCGTLERASGLEDARAMPGAVEADLDVELGTSLGALCSSLDRPAHVIADAETACEAVRRAEAALGAIKLELG